jgi:hypothetical protein
LAFMLELLPGVPLSTVTNTTRFYTRIKSINYAHYVRHIWINRVNIVCCIITRWNVLMIRVYVVFCFKSVPYKQCLRVLSILRFIKFRIAGIFLHANTIRCLYKGAL